ncbi:MAG TPA: YqjK-like family protein, partial [Gallionella sp.]|nr:YqjK-like family protein [Gallionella sp.]
QISAVMQRRSELLARIATQREQVAGIGARWQTPLALVDKGITIGRFLRSHPVLVASMIALFVIRRRGVVGLARSGWSVWKGYRFLTAILGKLSL